MKFPEPCELRRGGMKIETVPKKLTSGEKFFHLSTYFSIFLWLFDLRARALRSLETLDFIKGKLVSYYLIIIEIFN